MSVYNKAIFFNILYFLLCCKIQNIFSNNNRIVDCIDFFVSSPYKQSRCSGLFGFFNAHPLNQASLFRGFALKKPVTFVTGFVELVLQLSNKVLEDLVHFYEITEQNYSGSIRSHRLPYKSLKTSEGLWEKNRILK